MRGWVISWDGSCYIGHLYCLRIKLKINKSVRWLATKVHCVKHYHYIVRFAYWIVRSSIVYRLSLSAVCGELSYCVVWTRFLVLLIGISLCLQLLNGFGTCHTKQNILFNKCTLLQQNAILMMAFFPCIRRHMADGPCSGWADAEKQQRPCDSILVGKLMLVIVYCHLWINCVFW